MQNFVDAFSTAAHLLWTLDSDLMEIVTLSLTVSLSAVLLAGLVGLPLGASLAIARFPGRRALIAALNAMMGLPPVVVGLGVYLVLSRSGPLGLLGWLFTPQAMVTAQFLLIAPLVAALSRQEEPGRHGGNERHQPREARSLQSARGYGGNEREVEKGGSAQGAR